MKPARILRLAAPWLVVVAFVVVGGFPLLGPTPVRKDAPAAAFSAERAIEHVRAIAREPHPMGTAALAEVRAYLIARLEELELEVELQRFQAPNYYGRGESVPVVNVVARLPGAASTGAVALMAHYDTVPTTPGANDNAAAVATLLETARALRDGPALLNDVLLFFTDGEEPEPRYGANALVRRPRILDEVALVVNLEASGHAGASVLAEVSGPERWLLEDLAAGGCRPAAFSCLTETSRRMGDIGTDFDCFRNAGIPGFHFVYLHGSPIYHTPADDVSSVSLRSLQHHGAYAMQVVRRFGDVDFAASHADEGAVYFRAGPFFVLYPATWAQPLAVLAAVLLLLSIGGRSTSSAGRRRSAVGAVLREGAGGLLAVILGTLVWIGFAALRTTPGVLEAYGALLGLLFVGAGIAAKTAGRTDGPTPLVPGLFALLGLATATWLPGWSYVFTWPALAIGVERLLPDRRAAWIRYAVVAATTAVVITPAIALFFQFAQPRPGNPGSEMPAMVALPLLLGLLSLGLLRSVWPRHVMARDAVPV